MDEFSFDPTPFLDKIKTMGHTRSWGRIVSRLIWSVRTQDSFDADFLPAPTVVVPKKPVQEESPTTKSGSVILYPVGYDKVKELESGKLTRYQAFKIAHPDYKEVGLPRVNGKGNTKFLMQPPDQILKNYVIVVKNFST